LVEVAMRILPKEQPARVLDLGVGSGAILLAILAERPLRQASALTSAMRRSPSRAATPRSWR
jgi:release factor glutamine methyltransferase